MPNKDDNQRNQQEDSLGLNEGLYAGIAAPRPESLDVPWESDAQDERVTREAEISGSDDDFRPDDSWKPQALLPDPFPRDGWVHRYIRVSMTGNNDATNVSRQFREGWQPCVRSEYKEIVVPNDIGVQNSDQIQIGGLLLCRMPAEKARQRIAYHEKLSRGQMQSVDNNMFAQEDHRTNMSIHNPNRRTSFGNKG